MKLSEFIKKYGDFEIADEVQKLIEPKEGWKPKKGEEYWIVSTTGEVVCVEWYGYGCDLFNFDKRNVYRTKEEAQFALDMYEFCKKRSFEPNWKDRSEERYYLYLDIEDHNVYGGSTIYLNGFRPFYYPTYDAVQEVIHQYSFEELEKYYGRV